MLNKYIETMQRDGIVVIPADESFLEEIDKSVEEFYKFKDLNKDIVKKHEDENGYLYRVVNLHEKVTSLQSLFENNQTPLELLDYYLGEATIYTSLFFERGSGQDLHRDTPYFCTEPEYKYYGFWIALEDTDSQNGTLRVVKGAHKLPELDRVAIARKFYKETEKINPFDQRLWDEYQTQLQAQWEDAGLEVEEIAFKKGDSVIWNPQTPHGGSVILDPKRTRLSFVMHVTPPNIPVYHQDVFFSDITPSAKAKWNYKKIENRRYIEHGHISFAHQGEYTIDELK